MGIAVITMAGMNRAYEIEYKKSIFDDSVTPAGIDRETLFNRILYRCGEFSVLHADIDFMHDEICNFFATHYDTFFHWVKVLNQEYDPLENYNKTELYMGGNSHSNSDSRSSSGSSSGSNELKKSAFNASNYQPYEKEENSASDSSSISGSGSGSMSENHTLKVTGNIGVMTSQQMATQELELRRFNIICEIADMFAGEFTQMVY